MPIIRRKCSSNTGWSESESLWSGSHPDRIDTTETDIETIRHKQVDGEIGFEIKPLTLVDEREIDDMKKFIKRPAGYTAQQYEILDKVNEGLTEEKTPEISKDKEIIYSLEGLINASIQ